MSKEFLCPYCGLPKSNGESQLEDFCSCHYCGFKSAMVEFEGDSLLIVDRRMPFLNRRCQELSARIPEARVIVDRRIAQDDFKEPERRLSLNDGPEVS